MEDTNLTNLVINKLTEEQYNSLVEDELIEANELYLTIDEDLDFSKKEDVSNKVSSVNEESTDDQYPSVKCVYNSQRTQNEEISLLEKQEQEMRNNMITNTTEGTDINLVNSANLNFCKDNDEGFRILGNSTQIKGNGNQLFDINDTVTGYFTNDAGNTNGSGDGFRTSTFISTEENEIIYWRLEALDNCQIGRLWIQQFDENYNSLERTSTGIYDTKFVKGQIRTGSCTLKETTKYIKFSVYVIKEKLKDNTYSNRVPCKDWFSKYMNLTMSFTNINYYEPYTNQTVAPSPTNPQDINSVESNIDIIVSTTNLLKVKNGESITAYGLEVSIDENDIITINGTANGFYPEFLISGDGGIQVYQGTPSKSDFPTWWESINIPKSDYMLKFEKISGSGGNANRPFVRLMTNESSQEFVQGNTTKTKFYFGELRGISFYVNNATTWNNFKFRLSVIRSAEYANYTEHIKHKSQNYVLPIQQPMRSIGNVKDEFVKVDGEWFERHYIDEIILTGDEDWGYGNNRGASQIISSKVKASTPCIATALINKDTGWNENSINVGSNKALFVKNTNVFTSVETLVEYLTNNPMTVIYELNTPIDLPCTAEQTTILNQIYNEAKTYRGKTYIYTTNQIKPYMKTNYYKDTYLELCDIKNAVIKLGGTV